MSEPKRHHYLPQFYLNRFTDNKGLLWVFDRDTKEYRQQSSKNTMLQCHYYTFRDKDGKKHTEIEKFFSIIEGRTKPIIEKVDDKQKITAEEKEILATFISFQKTRVPDFEKKTNEAHEKMIKKMNQLMFSSKKRVESQFKKYERDTGKKINMSSEEFMNFVQNDKYYIKFPREHSIKLMLNLGKDFIMYFIQMNWLFLWVSPKTSFMTSDNPFMLLPPADYNPNSPYGIGIITAGAKKIIPLSQKTCLVMGDHGGEISGKSINRDVVRKINCDIAANSDRFVISRDKSLLKKIVSITKIDQRRREQRVQIIN